MRLILGRRNLRYVFFLLGSAMLLGELFSCNSTREEILWSNLQIVLKKIGQEK